ncbi:hypothetical protein SHIRM173S_05716 [Streptomyces hirsutus]
MPHPYVLLSAAVSLDGYLDDTGPDRLLLSGPEDFDRVDEVRASVDAILIGAGTIRADNPRLLVNAPERRAARVAEGRPAYPLKVTVSGSGDLDPAAHFWHTGGAKVLCTTDKGAERARAHGIAADIVPLGAELDWRRLLTHLYDAYGVRRLMVEGGGLIHTQLLTQGLADELQLVLAPLFVGDPDAARLFGPGTYQGGRLRLLETRPIGDVVLMRSGRAAAARPRTRPPPKPPRRRRRRPRSRPPPRRRRRRSRPPPRRRRRRRRPRRRPRPSVSPSWPRSTRCRPPRTPSPRPSVRPAPTGPPASTPAWTSPPPRAR